MRCSSSSPHTHLSQEYLSIRKNDKSTSFGTGWFGKSASSPHDANLRILKDELIDLERRFNAVKDAGSISLILTEDLLLAVSSSFP